MSVQQNQLGRLLCEAGWLPRDQRFIDSHASSGDLLPSIQQAWSSLDVVTLASNQRRRAERIQTWLATRAAQGAQLTLLSTVSSRAVAWLGERLLWWPRGRPLGSPIGIASSRLGQRLDTQADWFTVFRAACSKINHEHDFLLTAGSTTPDRYVLRAAELFGVRVVSLVCPRESEPIRAWFKRLLRLPAMSSNAIHRVAMSPELWSSPADSEAPAHLADLPLRDRAVISLADRLLVFHLRRGGHVEHLVRARLDDPIWPTATVFIALGADLVDRVLADDLLDRGAIGWVVLETSRHAEPSRLVRPRISSAPIVELPSRDNWQWLTHCTRAQADGWPDQSQTEYLDELLLNGTAADRSAFATIQRIVAMQCLVATARMIRGDTGTVCFTAVPLQELPRLRTFRLHLARWDFEPYGICIRKQWMEQRGCLPVRYGDGSLWESMEAKERPLFQMRTSRSRRSGRTIDWRIEREWRHVGDVDLRELPRDAGLVFVSTVEEAEQLAGISRWPVTVLRS